MSVERRFLTGAREADVDDAGLVIEDDGTVWKVAPGGTRTEVGASLPEQWEVSEAGELEIDLSGTPGAVPLTLKALGSEMDAELMTVTVDPAVHDVVISSPGADSGVKIIDSDLPSAATAALFGGTLILNKPTGELSLSTGEDELGGISQRWSSSGFSTTVHEGPDPISIGPGELYYWLDPSDGAPKAMFRGRSADGTLVEGSVPLTPPG